MEFHEKRNPINRIIREKIIVENGDVYPYCEINGLPLELMHNVPSPQAMRNEEINLVSICSHCGRRNSLHSQDIEFNIFLARLLHESKYFSDVQAGAVFGEESRFKVDIMAKIKTKTTWERLFIECKNSASFSNIHLEQTITQINRFRKVSEISRAVLAFPGRMTEKNRDILAEAGVEVWDIDFLATNFANELKKVSHPFFQPLLRSHLTVFPASKEERLINELRSCEPGKANWNVYQKLINEILDHLFHPPLEPPISEFMDFSKNNGRDIIIPNYACEGFWKFMRDKYAADYIVVDIKNYKGKVKKKDALQLVNSLKTHGSGLFGLIASRNGQDAHCFQTLKEEWVAHAKLILVLTDEHIEEMLLAKSSGGTAESTIGLLIEKFRIAL